MESQVKQRVVGVLVLLLLVIAVIFILYYGVKKNSHDSILPPENTSNSSLQNGTIEIAPETQQVIQGDTNTDTGGDPTLQKEESVQQNNEDNKPIDNASSQIATEEKDQAVAKNISETNQDMTEGQKVEDLSSPSIVTKDSENNDPLVAVMPASPKKVLPQSASSLNAQKSVQEKIDVLPQKIGTANKIESNKDNMVLTPKVEAKQFNVAVKQRVHKKIATLKKSLPKKIKPHFVSEWGIKVGTFAAPANAQELVRKLKSRGYHVYTKLYSTSIQGVLTQVYVGRVKDKASAYKLAHKLNKQFNVKAVIIKNVKNNKKIKKIA